MASRASSRLCRQSRPQIKLLAGHRVSCISPNYRGDPENNTPVEFYRDIWPTLRTVTHYGWTSAMAFKPHGPHDEPGDFLDAQVIAKIANPDDRSGDPYRDQIWRVLRHPEVDNVPPPPNPAPVPIERATEPQQQWKMPKLWGSGGEHRSRSNWRPTRRLSHHPWPSQRLHGYAVAGRLLVEQEWRGLEGSTTDA